MNTIQLKRQIKKAVFQFAYKNVNIPAALRFQEGCSSTKGVCLHVCGPKSEMFLCVFAQKHACTV